MAWEKGELQGKKKEWQGLYNVWNKLQGVLRIPLSTILFICICIFVSKHERGTIVVAKFCIMGWTNGQERSVFAPWLPIFCVGTSPVRSRV